MPVEKNTLPRISKNVQLTYLVVVSIPPTSIKNMFFIASRQSV